MRRVTGKQLVAMVTASTGLVASTGLTVAGLRTSLMAITPVLLASHDALAQSDELPVLPFQVVVTSTPIFDEVDEDTYTPQNVQVTEGSYQGGSGGTGGDKVPLDNTPARAALRCALKYSKAASGQWGGKPGWFTQINDTQWGWGTDPLLYPQYPAEISSSSETTPPIPDAGYFPIDGYTPNPSSGSTTSIIWVLRNQVDATAHQISLQAMLVNTIVHEWYHQWNPYADESLAEQAGDTAQSLYINGGGDKQNCATGS